MIYSFLALICLELVATAGSSQLPAQAYKAALKKHVAAVSKPMLEMLSSGRSKAVRNIVNNCRKGRAYLVCDATSDKASCATASGCVLRDRSEDKWMKPNQALMEKRYSAMSKFSESFTGWRRRFAIGTMNKLADQHNEISAKLISDQTPAIEQLMFECNKGQIEPTLESVSCIYTHFERTFAASADNIDQRAEKFKSYVQKDLMERIDGFIDNPVKPKK